MYLKKSLQLSKSYKMKPREEGMIKILMSIFLMPNKDPTDTLNPIFSIMMFSKRKIFSSFSLMEECLEETDKTFLEEEDKDPEQEQHMSSKKMVLLYWFF